MRSPFPKKKSRLPPQGKAVAAAVALHHCASGAMDGKAAGKFLKESVGLNWSVITAIQYLTGQEAIFAIRSLADGQDYLGLTKNDLLEMIALANHTAANVRPDGTPLSAGLLVKNFKDASRAT